jgi:TonB family protein
MGVLRVVTVGLLVALVGLCQARQNASSPPRQDLEEQPSSPCAIPGEKTKLVTQDEIKGKLLHKVAPDYPQNARQLGIEGTVVMCATIGKDGRITTLTPISGPQELVSAALKAVKKWRYAPFKLNGEIVDVQTDIRVNFRLDP